METNQVGLEEFLRGKRIDAESFRKALATTYAQWEAEFGALGPVKFDQFKKFQFNPYRLRFPLMPGLA